MGTVRFFLVTFILAFTVGTAEADVRTSDRHLYINGEVAPYLFGAELQYFRARGGSGRNVPAEEVIALWNRLLDRVQEAKMNTLIFYIPWDFHEPREGVFDFTGTLDEDKDGRPDYPSRNLHLFLKMIEARGIKNLMVRPGPYINAEWGPVGFGAIPRWFLENYPDALTGSKTAGRPKTASFGHPFYRAKVTRWFKTLHEQVLKDWIGPGRPVQFLQIDNETNFFWDSVYERDYSPTSRQRYTVFLADRYEHSIGKLNEAYGSRFGNFADVPPPQAATDRQINQTAWHYDWYLFHDTEILDYYRFLRATWEGLGVKEPQILFTSCDSYNAMAHGLLPRFDFRQGNQLTLSTMNVYPKTYGTQADSTLNVPMKAAHDASLVAASHRQVYGSLGNWVMSSETVGGWFPPTEVSLATRQHTYGSLIGGGIKAMMIYYFHEGWNWDGLEGNDSELNFDAPVDKAGNPRPAFQLVKSLGQSLAGELGRVANESEVMSSPILLAHDHSTQYPLAGAENALLNSAEDSAALYGFFRELGYLPAQAFLNQATESELQKYRVIVLKNSGYLSAEGRKKLEIYLAQGGVVFVMGPNPFAPETPGVVHFATDPAQGWNSDAYPKLATAQASLSLVAEKLNQLGLKPSIRVQAADGKPYLHAWVRGQEGKASLLFVENFSREARAFRLEFGAGLLPSGNVELELLHSADGISLSQSMGTEATVPLRIGPDSVSIWKIKANP